MMEGTANYVARLAVGEPPARTAERLRTARPAKDIRWRFYDTGAALCFLADRLSPGWQDRVEREPNLTVAELLGSSLRARAIEPAAFSNADTARFRTRATDTITDLSGRQQRLRSELLGRRGGRIVIDVAQGVDAFRVQRFDPINLMVLDAGEVAHNHFVSLVARQGTIELTNPGFVRYTFGGVVTLTVPAGRHPLSDGIRQVTIVGIEGAPKIGRDGDTVTLEASGVRLTLRGVEARVDGEAVRITVERSLSTDGLFTGLALPGQVAQHSKRGDDNCQGVDVYRTDTRSDGIVAVQPARKAHRAKRDGRHGEWIGEHRDSSIAVQQRMWRGVSHRQPGHNQPVAARHKQGEERIGLRVSDGQRSKASDRRGRHHHGVQHWLMYTCDHGQRLSLQRRGQATEP